MALGNLLLITLAAFISEQPPWTIGLLDAGYLVAVGSLLLARTVDIKRFAGETVHGEPASRRDLVRYALGLSGVSGALWLVAQNFQL
jgi:hypothetical protein